MYAHSVKGQDPRSWEPLARHLQEVADTAAGFAAPFDSGDWAELLGALHDVGKAREAFQKYLLSANGLTDLSYDAAPEHNHSGAGACWAAAKFGKLGRILAYCIAGHHAGLPDWAGGVAPNGALQRRLETEKTVLDEPAVAEWLRAHEGKWSAWEPVPPWKCKDRDVSFWIRMLFSCLVDADFLCTERFMSPEQAGGRGGYPPLAELAATFFAKLDEKEQAAPATEVNRIRAKIRAHCEEAAQQPPGLFSLTVPTGGGKTLSGTAFALRHALEHGMKRIIYVIPYTSIIEQTADVLRDFLGADNVVEHHSNLDPDKETQQSRMAAENWDAPVIVTTTVQFFESLYACRTSRCRKLHNIAQSVVILDEAQLLPPHLLWPCTEALAQLVAHYRVCVVLSTATQPALATSGPLADVPVREIIPEPQSLYARLKRTDIILPADLHKRATWEEIADELRQYPQVLCVVNTRRDAKELARLVGEDTVYLSTLLCGEHRSRKIATIKERLAAGEAVRVVSTQLVEAGVDIDFPVVYRAFAGLPSIAQAAGRCNREGKSDAPGKVVAFMPSKASPPGELRKAEDVYIGLLASSNPPLPDDPESYPRFFAAFYQAQNDDGKKSFYDWLARDYAHFAFQFREAAAAFKIIEDNTVPAIVRYGESDKWINVLRETGPKREIMRRLQRFTVNVYRDKLPRLLQSGLIEELPPAGSGLYAQTMPSLYDEVFGLELEREALSPDELIF